MKSIRKRDTVWATAVLILLLFLGGDDKCEISDDTCNSLLLMFQYETALLALGEQTFYAVYTYSLMVIGY